MTLDRRSFLHLCAGTPAAFLAPACAARGPGLLNVSYDTTREFYRDYNRLFTHRRALSGASPVRLRQSHGGSGKQTFSVISGLEADVVTLALAYDIDAIAQKGLIARDWARRLPFRSTPFYSTILFMVRKGNPLNIRDWNDLARPHVSVITPNPKTSGGARWNYLAAWGHAMQVFHGNEKAAFDFMVRLYRNVPVLDAGARASATTFAQRLQGDVLIAWESEAFLLQRGFKDAGLEVILPSVSIRAETPVAWVDAVVERQHTLPLAQSYLRGLYTPEAQQIAAEHHFRPQDVSVAARFQARFPHLHLLEIDRDFGGWKKAHDRHFADGALFDQIFTAVNQGRGDHIP